MKKQYGVTFEAPKCTGHGEEMQLSVMRPNNITYVEWYCPQENVDTFCGDVRDVQVEELPEELKCYLDPAYWTSPDRQSVD